MGSSQYWAGRFYGFCLCLVTGAPEGSSESGFMGKLGIESATPSLQGSGLSMSMIQYYQLFFGCRISSYM